MSFRKDTEVKMKLKDLKLEKSIMGALFKVFKCFI